jgi:hypothetical protein
MSVTSKLALGFLDSLSMHAPSIREPFSGILEGTAEPRGAARGRRRLRPSLGPSPCHGQIHFLAVRLVRASAGSE